MNITPREAARFWAKVDKTGTCWLWTASVGNHGYGQMGVAGGVQLAHRIAYALAFGEIPEGLTIDHLCMVKRCVNPGHLEAVSRAENVRRAHDSGVYYSLAHCPQGHPRTPDVWRTKQDGRHYCAECHRARQRAKAGAA